MVGEMLRWMSKRCQILSRVVGNPRQPMRRKFFARLRLECEGISADLGKPRRKIAIFRWVPNFGGRDDIGRLERCN